MTPSGCTWRVLKPNEEFSETLLMVQPVEKTCETHPALRMQPTATHWAFFPEKRKPALAHKPVHKERLYSEQPQTRSSPGVRQQVTGSQTGPATSWNTAQH